MFNINSTLSRRNFLAGAAALGSTAALAGCSSGGSDGGTADDGKTFTKIKTFEKGLAEYSYPSVVVKGDTIHITYTYERDYIAYWQIKIK